MSTLKEVLSNFKKELGNTLQAQKNILDVTQKYIGLLEDAEGGSGSGGIDYSTTEQDTGIKWIDGKEIYQITLTKSNVPKSTEDAVLFDTADMPAGLSNIISIEPYFIDSTSVYPGNMYTSNTSYFFVTWVTSNKIYRRNTWGSTANFNAICTIRYTKE